MVKNLPANVEDVRGVGLVLESPMDRGAWWVRVLSVAKS